MSRFYVWHSEDGVLYHQEEESPRELGEKLKVAVAERAPQLLLPSERRFLTSAFVGERFLQHSIRVSSSGRRVSFTALSFRFEPELLAGELVFLPQPDVSSMEMTILPDQRPFIMIALPCEEAGLIRIVDLVFYRPPDEEPLPFSMN